MKNEFPKTYDYLYELLDQDIKDLDKLNPRQRYNVAWMLSKDRPQNYVYDMVNGEGYFLSKIDEFLGFNIDGLKEECGEIPVQIFMEELAEHLFKNNKDRLEQIFEFVMEDYLDDHPELKLKPDRYDWKLQDDSMRMQDFR